MSNMDSSPARSRWLSKGVTNLVVGWSDGLQEPSDVNYRCRQIHSGFSVIGYHRCQGEARVID